MIIFISAYMILMIVLTVYCNEENRSTDSSPKSSIGESEVISVDFELEAANNSYNFIVQISYAKQLYSLGIYFQPRFILTPYLKISYYHELDIYVISWNNSQFDQPDLIRKVRKVETYDEAPHCDFDLSVIELNNAFQPSDGVGWKIDFWNGSQPEIGTNCTIIHLSKGRFYTVEAQVRNGTDESCIKERGFMHSCDETFLCLSTSTPMEIDITSAPVLCKNQLVGTVPGYYIREITVIQFLPLYSDWIEEHSDSHLTRNESISLYKYSNLFIELYIILLLLF